MERLTSGIFPPSIHPRYGIHSSPVPGWQLDACVTRCYKIAIGLQTYVWKQERKKERRKEERKTGHTEKGVLNKPEKIVKLMYLM